MSGASGAGPRRRLAARLFLLAIVAGGATLAIAASEQSAPRKVAYPAHFPVAPGATVAQHACLVCHSAMLITQQHKDSTGWEKTMHTMETWGVQLSPSDRDSLMSYLRRQFGVAPVHHL